MAIYTFKLLVGFFPDGVDNAQAYRTQMLGKYKDEIKYIFTEIPGRTHIDYYVKTGIFIDQIIGVHSYLTDNTGFKLTCKVDELLAEIKRKYKGVEILDKGNQIAVYDKGMRIINILLDQGNREYYYAVGYLKNERLIRTEYYTDGLSYIEYFYTNQNGNLLSAKLVRRTYFNKDQSVAFDQLFEGDKELYVFPDGEQCSKYQLLIKFMEKLNLSKEDVIIMDRPPERFYVQVVFQYSKPARLIAIFHSDHYFEKNEADFALYLNYEYYYYFKCSKYLDTIVVSTEEQKQRLISKLKEYNRLVPRIEVIPAGGIASIKISTEKRKPYSLMTASRMIGNKKIDWIIKAVVKAHQKNPGISLDIYGTGEERYVNALHECVDRNNAQSYIRFMGQQKMDEIYKEYEVYISASLFETYGLSLLEATASGNALIGLNVRYGNRIFIQNNQNGYLLDYNPDQWRDDEKITDCMSEAILKIFSNQERLEKFHEKSYEISKRYVTDNLVSKWEELLFE